jgi:hypothetical protein
MFAKSDFPMGRQQRWSIGLNFRSCGNIIPNQRRCSINYNCIMLKLREIRVMSESKLTVKKEKFAQAYIETGNATAAYRQAYNAEKMKPETIWSNASRLLADGKVAARVEQLQAEARERHNVTADALTAELEEARMKAMADPKGASAAVAATMGKARLHGLLVNKTELTGKEGGPIQSEAGGARERFMARIEAIAARNAATSGAAGG